MFRELKSCFVVFGLKAHLDILSSSRRAEANTKAIDFVFEQMDKPAKLRLASAIDTESNLSSKVFDNIAASLSIESTGYAVRYHLIDQSLVERRNKVAHGEYLDIDGEDWGKLADEVLLMMRQYKTDIENAATLQLFKRSAAEIVS